MMPSLAQTYSPHPGGIQQHQGVQQGHPMAGGPHNPGQQVPGQPGMPQQMHMGVSGPGGPQVSQAGAMMGGMPPGAGGPSAHALQHLNPGQAQQAQPQLYQQQMFANNGQIQQLQQQQIIQHQRAQQAQRQALMAQQYSGMPMGVPNGMGQMTQAQFAAMRGGPMARSVHLPQHLQQAQQQAQHSLAQEQQAQQHAQQAHQQQMIAQQMALQQQQAQGGNPAQQGQMHPQQMQNLQQAQMVAAQQQHQQAQAQAAAAAQQSQGQQQPQPQGQQTQPNSQAQPQQAQPQGQQQQGGVPPQQQAAVAAAMLQQQQQRQGDKLKGQCLMRLMQFGDHLSYFGVNSKPLKAYMTDGAQRLAAQGMKQRNDLNYWLAFVDRFFSPRGVFRHSVWIVDETSNKQYEITFPALARYFHTHFESGVKNIQMIMEKRSEKELPNNGHYIESQKSSFVYWFDNGSHLIASGTLRAHFDAEQKIELLEFVTSRHDEYLPLTKVVEAASSLHEWAKEWQKVNALPEGKQSPEMNKKKAKTLKSPPHPPPEIDLPPSKIKPNMGITPSVFQFLELAEVMGQMNPLFNYSQSNGTFTPYTALESYVTSVAQNGNNPNQGASPAAAHLQLPDGSPHISSPAQAPGMQLQQSQHGTSSSGPSANTSPNASNKRRRPSTVKIEEETQVNGTQANKAVVKPSPRIGKRQKNNPA